MIMATKLMDSIVENSINQGLKNNLKDAIASAGVKVTANTGLWEYPEIIRNKMAINTINGINLIAGDSIKITHSVDDNNTSNFEISTSIDSYKLHRPIWASENNSWNKELGAQAIFNDLFANILPNVRGVYAGDMSSTNNNGDDTRKWNNTLFGVSGNKTGLKPNSRYLRLYLTSQHEPLYIYTGSYLDEITGGYNVMDSDTVSFSIDEENQLLTAHINIISEEQIRAI